jgi:RNA polymerase sigma-70 factor (ECF subfamily)
MPPKPMPSKEDAHDRLLVDAAQKDPARFVELYEENFERVYSFVARRVQDRADAEDLTAEVFQQALANLERFEWRGLPFAAWLYRIAANAIADRWQRVSRERGDPNPGDRRDEREQMNPEEVERRAQILRLVQSLPGDQRRVIEMRFACEKSIREIASELKRTTGAVKQLQFRGIENLRELLDKSPRKKRRKIND